MNETQREMTTQFWDAEASRKILAYPDENIVRFLASRFPNRAENSKARVAELGCGNGRNLLLLSDYGFVPTGIDLSETAIKNCRDLFRANDREGLFFVGAFQDVLNEEARLDLIVWDSPCLENPSEMRASFSRVLAMLAPGGQLWTRFRHPDSWFSKLGDSGTDGAIVLDERAREYANSLYTFLNSEEAENLLKTTGLEVLNRERVELWKNMEQERHVWNTFWAYKPH
jgi:SAM-dependent methyltransferase